MKYCGRCGKEISETDGLYCDSCFSEIIQLKANGGKITYKKVPEKREAEDKLIYRNPDANEKSIQPVRYVKRVGQRSYLKLFIGVVCTMVGALSLVISFLLDPVWLPFTLSLGITLLVVGVCEVLKEMVLSTRADKIASIFEVAALGFGIILIISFAILRM